MGRFTKELAALKNRIKKLKKNKSDGYWAAFIHRIKTGEMPINSKLREQMEFEQRSLLAMMATCPQPDPVTCRNVRLKAFGELDCLDHCNHCTISDEIDD